MSQIMEKDKEAICRTINRRILLELRVYLKVDGKRRLKSDCGGNHLPGKDFRVYSKCS